MLYDEITQPGSYICHHGVKGMKWGVRNDKRPSYRKLTKEERRLSGADFDGDDPYRNARKRTSVRRVGQTSGPKDLHSQIKSRYQNEDGTLTKEGRKRFGRYGAKVIKDIEQTKRKYNVSGSEASDLVLRKARNDINDTGNRIGRMSAVGIGAVVAATAVASVAALPITALTTPMIAGGIALASAVDNIVTTEQRTTLDSIEMLYDRDRG